ncbi:MAG: glycosyltransferase family 39 protein [Candidatus Levybacteria bacterium]|nr:glycosyltransferase family 39 protein [Candidatus Levybacteria bacterium]
MNRVQIFIVIIILVLGLILRLHNYEKYPQRGATSDEYTYAFLGISLLKDHVPISWSAFPAYKNLRHLTIKKLYFPIVWPYFDHPPLSGFLTGGLSLLVGHDSFEKVDLKVIRLIPIVLSTFSSVFLFLIAFRLYNYKTAVWALLIYSTVAIFVINGRVALSENLLTPLLLLSLYLFSLLEKKISYMMAIIFGILSGLSFWTKEAGIVVFLTLFYLLKSGGLKIKPFIVFVVITFLIVGSYFLYGAYYDWDLFLKIWSAQSGREIGPQTLHMLFSNPIIVNKPYMDGWYFFGFLSIFYSLIDFKKNKLIIVPVLLYILLLIFSLTRHGEMGWYVIPLFPFMAIASARMLVKNIENKSWYIFTFLLFVGLAETKFLYEDVFGLTPVQFRIILVLLFGPLFISLLFNKQRLFGALSYLWFYIFILGNIILTYNYIHPS